MPSPARDPSAGPPELEGVAAPRRYHLLELAGRGAYGDVYLAELDSGGAFRRRVALKVLNENASRLRSARHRMQEEARILGRLAHRHIVAALDFVRLDHRWAIVMDYVPGADLEHVVAALERAGDRFPGPAVFEIGAAIADALRAAYEATDDNGEPLRIVHRDIKPSNVRLTADGDVKVLDFGVARGPNEAEARGTGLVGTEQYMAPERLLNTADLPAGDVYSVGATLVELALGRPLGRTPVMPDEHAEFVSDALTAVRLRLAGSPAVVDRAVALLRAALAGRHVERPSALELATGCDELARALDGEGLRPFCRRVVPKLDQLLGRTSIPVAGVWSEELTGDTSFASNRTLIPDNMSDGPAVSDRPGFLKIAAWLAFTASLSALCGGALVVGFGGLLWPVATDPIVGAVIPATAAEAAAPELPPEPGIEPPPVVAPAPVDEPARRVSPPRTKPVSAAVPATARPSAGPRIEKAQFTLPDASRLTVDCGGVRLSGTSSVRLTGFPSGPCVVSADYLGRTLGATVRVDRIGRVGCVVAGDELSCQLR